MENYGLVSNRVQIRAELHQTQAFSGGGGQGRGLAKTKA